MSDDMMNEIRTEGERLGGVAGMPLDSLLINMEGTIEGLRCPESEEEDSHETRRESLLSLAAWALLALKYEDAHPGLDMDEVAEPMTKRGS